MRIGLVLYGGVSLAIYMYGVVLEVWRLVRASRAIEGGRDAIDAEKRTNPWVDVLERARVSVVVDLISGASAGGLNGILLAKALVEGADLKVAEDIWLKVADIKGLLHATAAPEPTSVLRSAELRKELRDGLADMEAAGDSVRLADVFDLFISTTHLEGHPEQFADDLRTSLPTKRHRVPVNLRYRDPVALWRTLDGKAGSDNDRDDFTAEHDALLTAVGAATSAFPVAFEPQEVGDGLDKGEVVWPDGSYSDGGILDNKPFTDVLATTFARAATSDVERWLVSVDPDTQTPEFAEGPLDFVDVATAAVFSIPRYESIAEDLQKLRDHNEHAAEIWEEAWRREAEIGSEGVAAADPDEEARYAASRRHALVSFLLAERLRVHYPVDPRAVDKFGEAQLIDRAVVPGAEPAIDVAREVRRAYYVVNLLRNASPAQREQANEARVLMWRRIETLRNATWRAVAPDQDLDLTELTGAMTEDEPGPDALPGLLIEVPSGAVVPLREAWSNYAGRDSWLLLLDYAGIRTGHGHVKHAQISAVSAKAITPRPELKLAGDTAGHFGGFLSRPWRENDMRWGRLDGADILAGILAREAEPADRGAAQELRDELTNDVQQSIAAEYLIIGEGWKEEIKRTSLGTETVFKLGIWELIGFAYRIVATLRTMFRNVAASPGTGLRGKIKGGGSTFADWLLGLMLTVLRPFYWAGFQSHPAQFIAALAGLAFFWGVVTLAVLVPTSTVSLADVWLPCVIAIAPLLIWSLFLARLVGSRWWARR